VYEEPLTGWPHDTSVQKATSENVDAVQRHVLDENLLGRSFKLSTVSLCLLLCIGCVITVVV